jgi:hypothetical protein
MNDPELREIARVIDDVRANLEKRGSVWAQRDAAQLRGVSDAIHDSLPRPIAVPVATIPARSACDTCMRLMTPTAEQRAYCKTGCQYRGQVEQ